MKNLDVKNLDVKKNDVVVFLEELLQIYSDSDHMVSAIAAIKTKTGVVSCASPNISKDDITYLTRQIKDLKE